ncbi:SCO7613 C-terminal domain-containing membrane protein [Nocardioides piscis]|uniref:DUF2157 domain-containing protein n=1 Tax=Nocardioides piscis TaxID=2714938 RepID=A0A6G7YI45_9ACTN|nr:hypothetical protein [Nocardioides piscis]QIK76482.1 hypothetical protein G7071_14670 [Nocardioides piscis]
MIPGAHACPACGLRLTGPEAARLWQVHQHIAALTAEADSLIAVLLRPPSKVGRPAPHPFTPPAAPAVPRKQLTGQQILLGLGALLLLSGVAFFLLVVWFLIGLVGQAAIMVALTATAAGSAVLATRRGLPAAAETAGSIATGLLVLDLWAAHRLNLAGLGDLPGDAYWAVAGVLGAALLIGFDRLVPRTVDGQPARRMVVYPPAATTLLAVAGWSLLSALDLEPLGLGLVALLLAVVSGVGAVVVGRSNRWAAAPLLLLSVTTVAVHFLAGAYVGYDPDSSGVERYAAFALLLAVPAMALAAPRLQSVATGRSESPYTGPDLRLLPMIGVVALLPALGIPVIDAHRIVVVLLAVLLAAALCALTLLGRPQARAPWSDAALLVAWVAQPALFLVVLLLVNLDYSSGQALLAGEAADAPYSLWLPVLPAIAWATSAVVAAVRARSAAWVVVAQVAVLCVLLTALRDSQEFIWVMVALLACAVSFVLAGFARTLADSTESRLLDYSAIAFALLYGAGAIVSSLEETRSLQAAAWIAVGVLTIVYSGSRNRLPFAYLGSLLVSIGTSILLDEQGITTIELYTAPLMALLAAIGVVQHARNPHAPTLLTMGPALSVALLPSLAAALDGGSAVRLAGVTLAAIVVLAIGLLKGWRAPVTVGGVALVVVAIYQGGPYVGYVPTWVTLVLGGTLLLIGGVAWERAIAAGRRSQAWYSALR